MTYHFTAIATLAALIVYVGMGIVVARTRGRTGIHPPAMTGDPGLERTIRAQANTLEWLPVFLAGLWLFALYWGDLPAALVGAVWIIGRILYARGYIAEAPRRSTGFLIQALASAVLLFGALAKAVYLLAAGG